MSDIDKTNPEEKDESLHDSIPVTGMYKDWFLDYASYVILERAVPAIEDGLKPVQRRILHAMKEMDDGRFNKVANIIGQSMQYHPHGDASIGDAIVNLGQKDLLIETQGNWGDIRTGDSAAAARYIEARLSKFALEVVFNPQTTDWQLSYDGRKREPVTLPVKFPLLLAQGVEGIAVGLSTKILPHNFIELIQGSIAILKGEKTNILPDFPTGGLADFSEYNEGQRGGRIKVRARIEEEDNKTLLIKDIPFGTTTNSLIDSIIKANDKGKIKIKKVVDNTAKDVEIQIQLAPGQSPDMTIDALYAFTDCEVSISPNACVIINEKPVFLSVNEILEYNTQQTKSLLKRELEIRKGELMEKLLFSSLEKIFIENRIYRDIEECETWEAVLETIDRGLDPFKPDFYREITTEDIIRLTEIRIKRISKFDSFKADELMRKLQEELKEVNYNLKHLTEFAIKYYENLLTKYGKGRERKTEIRTFDTIEATVVAANNAKLYVNRADGFVGYGLKKDEFVCDCSDLDDIIVFRRDGKCLVTKIQEKGFVGKDIIHVGVFRKGDERMVYNLIYLDGTSGRAMVKRFQVLGVTRDREYDLTKGTKGSKVLYLTANPNGEAEIVTVYLTQGAKARIKVFDFDFSTIEIKGRSAGGNILTKYPVRKIQLKMEGVSTLGGLDVYYDAAIGRLNTDQRGKWIGNFLGEDRIIVFYKNGDYELTSFELTNRYEANDVLLIEKFDPEKVVSAIYYDGASKNYFVKRFLIETTTINKKFNVISDHKQSKLVVVSTDKQPQVRVKVAKGKEQEELEFDLDMLIDVKGWKAIGNKLTSHQVLQIDLIQNEPKKEQTMEGAEEKGEGDEDIEIGSTVSFKVKKDEDEQLGLF
ncbi:DNA gyrase/topoisomerase IV subunit A [Cecembia calidifontis]|jgi:topoisomerase-4 subunit A|uniref:Topoisomerase-4 subunit A n=1 Tax=Cecembia calidifontis TaxID=1187080 RepID=A0A4Q7PB29_9BACT|nr:DNA gyrase/topoisomerase IV subunit A [Cecembia calidifontis]RZS97441.1 topoisomerase-4 subunit A [Cecembia calidifontis]